MPYLQYTPEELYTEKWRDVVGYEGHYQVSNIGRVKRITGTQCRQERILKVQPHDGYAYISLSLKAKVRFIGIHILVARAFLGPYPYGCEVNHIDHNGMNPRLGNLEYVTHRRNTQYAAESGRLHTKPRGKLIDSDIPTIRRMIANGKTNTAIARRFQVSRHAISNIKHKKNWKHIP